MKVTVFKPYRKTEVINRLELQETVRMMAEGDLVADVHRLRGMYHLMRVWRKDDGQVVTNIKGSATLPRVCFAAEYENRYKERRLLKYNGLVVLEINNLAGYDEAIAIREAVRRLPQTMLAFLGASGRSVKIVCRGELFPDRRKDGQTLPTAEADVEKFHQNLYQTARKAYNGQLDVTIETMQPRLDRTVYLSTDPDLIWNEQAVPFYADVDSGQTGDSRPLVSDNRSLDYVLLPGRSVNRSYQLNYMFILDSVMGRYFELPDEERQAELLMRIASQCLLEGIPMAMAQALTLLHPVFNGDELLVKKTFSAVYTVEHLRQYQEKHKFRPLQSIPDDKGEKANSV